MTTIPTRAILGVQNVAKDYGSQPVLRDVSLTVHEGDRLGLMGRNGAGKSTLLRIMAGIDAPDSGLVARCQGLRVGLLAQQCALDPQKTVGQVLLDAANEVSALLREYHRATEELAATPHDAPDHDELAARCAELQHHLETASAWTPEVEIKRVSTSLCVPAADRTIGTLSGGEARRTDLAATLIRRPDLLLLDEPTNQMDTTSVEWIEEFLQGYQGSCVLVTHDRYFLDRVVTRIVEIDSNRLYSFPGNYTRFLEYKTALIGQERRAEDNRQAFLRRELGWIRRGPKARTSKDKKRIERFYEIDADGPRDIPREMKFEIPAPQRLGKRILETHRISATRGEKVLFKDLSFFMLKDMRVGIIGPNGCGKSTLLRTIMGIEPPDRGEVLPGDNTQFLYVDQVHEEVDPRQSIIHFVSNGDSYWQIGDRKIFVPVYLERFLFDRHSVRMPMRNLSGGETNRVILAKKLLRGGNLLVLDEPTNDLDLDTLRVLEEAVIDFEGCAFIVSHDRYFINRTCTHLLIFEGDGRIVEIAGNYDDYVAYRKRIAEETPAPEKKTPQRQPRQETATEGAPRRLSWKETKELERIESEILEAESEVSLLETRTTDPAFYREPAEMIRQTLADLDIARDRVETLYARWQDLELLRQT